MLNKRNTLIVIMSSMVSLTANSVAEVIEYEDKSAWEDAVGDFTTIDFTGFPLGTIITDQYSDLGVIFTDGDDLIYLDEFLFPDGSGLVGSMGEGPITVEFDNPQNWIAVDYPGVVRFELFSSDVLIYTSIWFSGGGQLPFAGLISSDTFDAAVISTIGYAVTIDDLHFGAAVPGTGSGVLLLLSSALWKKRRR